MSQEEISKSRVPDRIVSQELVLDGKKTVFVSEKKKKRKRLAQSKRKRGFLQHRPICTGQGIHSMGAGCANVFWRKKKKNKREGRNDYRNQRKIRWIYSEKNRQTP